MATKKATAQKAPAATPAKTDPNGYQIKAAEWGFTKGDTDSQVMAALSTRSALTATTYKAFAGGGDGLEVTDVMGELRKAGEEVASGNMSRVEKMLAHQALTLDAIFNNMAQRASRAEYVKNTDIFLKLALKAQAQARSTAEALALLKNPMPYIKQANIAQGHLQVNNTYASASGHTSAKEDVPEQSAQGRTHAENFQSVPNKLLEAEHDQRLDTRAQGAAGRANQKLESMG